MRSIAALLLMLALVSPSLAQSRAALVREEQQLRKKLDAGAAFDTDPDIDLDANRFDMWQALASNLEKQGRIEAAIAVMYQGAGEIPTRSADFRAASRWATNEAIRFEERLKGPTETTTRATWGAAISVQRGRSPVDRMEAGIEPFANGYLNETIRRLTAIGRHDEASALAMGAMEIATSFRLHRAMPGVQDREISLYRERAFAMRTVVRTAYALATTMDPAIDTALARGDMALRDGDNAGAERRFRDFLAGQPDPIIVSRFRLRATIGLIRALRGQDKADEAARLRAELLAKLRWQLWRDGPEIAAVEQATL